VLVLPAVTKVLIACNPLSRPEIGARIGLQRPSLVDGTVPAALAVAEAGDEAAAVVMRTLFCILYHAVSCNVM
jgi:hypothetical protein